MKTETSNGFWQYGDDFPGILIELSGPSQRLLVYMSQHMRYDNKILLTKEIKSAFCAIYNISYKSINKSITELQYHNTITKVNNSFYFLNPLFIFKGDLSLKKQIITDYENIKHLKTKLQRTPCKTSLL